MSTKTNAQIQSIRTKLASLARAQGLQYPQALTIFLLERVAVRLLLDEVLVRGLVFKGGYVSVRVYDSPRHTTDLDVLARGVAAAEAEPRIKTSMAKDVGDGCWFEFQERIDLKTQGEYGGIRFSYRGGLGERPPKLALAQVINVDVGIGDPVTPGPRVVVTPLTLGTGQLSWQVYPIETVIAEKLHAVVTLGSRNSRAKDIFDLMLFLPKAPKLSLAAALQATFGFRGDALPDSISNAIEALDTATLRRGWPAAVLSVKNPPTFDEAFATIVARLRDWGI